MYAHATRPRSTKASMRTLKLCFIVAACTALTACMQANMPANAQSAATDASRATTEAASTPATRLVAAARKQIGVTTRYDPAYTVLPYPGGDVPQERGVCTDVVIRAFRTQNIDLQRSVHEDMRANFALYPKKWGLRKPDRNIDHRRVPNLQTWFSRQGWRVTPKGERASDASNSNFKPGDFKPGDLVTWMLPGNLPHIGIVSDRKSLIGGTPLIIHNIGRGTQEDDILFDYAITGHYRPKPLP
jgi:uncharacterized protein